MIGFCTIQSARSPDPARLTAVLRLAGQLLREPESTRIIHALLILTAVTLAEVFADTH